MNKWECEAPGCQSTAVGVGGAVGLRAIGWYFVRGGRSFGSQAPTILCPWHRPDGVECREPDAEPEERDVHHCSMCAAENEAGEWQASMK